MAQQSLGLTLYTVPKDPLPSFHSPPPGLWQTCMRSQAVQMHLKSLVQHADKRSWQTWMRSGMMDQSRFRRLRSCLLLHTTAQLLRPQGCSVHNAINNFEAMLQRSANSLLLPGRAA